VRWRLRLEDLRKGILTSDPVAPYLKDYDVFPEDRPTSLARRLDLSKGAIFAAYMNDVRVGGLIVAPESPEVATIYDVRLATDARCIGIGRALMAQAKAWATSEGFEEIHVETQDINVPACQFYAACGFSLVTVDEHAYPPELRETKLIWKYDTNLPA